MTGRPSPRQIGVAAIAAAIAFACCEVSARLFFPAPPDPTREPQLVYRYDPVVKYVLAANQRGWIDDAMATVNSLGFRGAELLFPKPASRFRVVFVGDSVTFGMGVNDAETFPAQLELLLHTRFPGKDLDVINLGVPGYDTRQEVLLLERYVASLSPDVVMLGFYTNDVPEALDDDNSSAAGATKVLTDHPEPGQILHLNQLTPHSWLERQLRRSRAMFVAGRAINRVRGAGEWGMSRFSLELDMLQGKASPSLDAAWSKVAKQLDSLHSLAVDHGFRAGVVALPSRELVMGQYPGDHYVGRLRDLAASRDELVVDPLPLLMAAPGKKTALFIPYDRNHPTAAGDKIIAQAILDSMARTGLLRVLAEPGATERRP